MPLSYKASCHCCKAAGEATLLTVEVSLQVLVLPRQAVSPMPVHCGPQTLRLVSLSFTGPEAGPAPHGAGRECLCRSPGGRRGLGLAALPAAAGGALQIPRWHLSGSFRGAHLNVCVPCGSRFKLLRMLAACVAKSACAYCQGCLFEHASPHLCPLSGPRECSGLLLWEAAPCACLEGCTSAVSRAGTHMSTNIFSNSGYSCTGPSNWRPHCPSGIPQPVRNPEG